jgi:hypothetical protein
MAGGASFCVARVAFRLGESATLAILQRQRETVDWRCRTGMPWI